MDAPLQPAQVAWDERFELGHAELDAQHRELLALCNQLAGLCAAGDEQAFDEGLARLKRLAADHVEAELAWLRDIGDPGLDDHRTDCDEFGYLADEIATPAHFDRVELQRFLALWWFGHVADVATRRQQGSAEPPA